MAGMLRHLQARGLCAIVPTGNYLAPDDKTCRNVQTRAPGRAILSTSRSSDQPPGTVRTSHCNAIVLVANDVEETRDGIGLLLSADGYRVEPARNESEAIDKASRQRPDLILISLSGHPVEVIASAARIRHRASLGDEVPVVVFGMPVIDEGDELAIGRNVYVTWPDNFDQLRDLLARLLPAVTAGDQA
jgi:CheY-like chemotaxis protein